VDIPFCAKVPQRCMWMGVMCHKRVMHHNQMSALEDFFKFNDNCQGYGEKRGERSAGSRPSSTWVKNLPNTCSSTRQDMYRGH